MKAYEAFSSWVRAVMEWASGWRAGSALIGTEPAGAAARRPAGRPIAIDRSPDGAPNRTSILPTRLPGADALGDLTLAA